MPAASNPTIRGPLRGQTVHWLIAILLAVIATALWTRPAADQGATALAQNRGLAGARGVYAFTGQLAPGRDGLFMLDVDQGTIWCYEIETANGTWQLRLIAARTWIYDRYLQDFNCAPPSFRMVQELVAQQREQVGSREPALPAQPRTTDDAQRADPGDEPNR